MPGRPRTRARVSGRRINQMLEQSPAKTEAAVEAPRKRPLVKPVDGLLILQALAGRIVYGLLPLRALYRLAALVARLDGLRLPRTNDRIEAAISASLPAATPDEVRHIRARQLQYLQKLHLTYRIAFASKNRQGAGYEIEGLEHLETALQAGKGVILLTCHFGYGRMIEVILERRGIGVLVMGREQKESDQELSRLGLAADRLLSPANFRGRDIKAGLNLRPLLQALGRNEIVLTAGDGNFSRTVVYANLLNLIVPFFSGTFRVAATSGAAILPAFVVDDDPSSGSFRLVIQPPLPLSDPQAQDLTGDVETFARAFEAQIAKYPHLLDWRKRSRYTKRTMYNRRPVRFRRHVLGLENAIAKAKAERTGSEPVGQD